MLLGSTLLKSSLRSSCRHNTADDNIHENVHLAECLLWSPITRYGPDTQGRALRPPAGEVIGQRVEGSRSNVP